jgi:mannose-1-phosphate guanylyltransferase/mannose-6-phosphate isomerase
VPVILSGGSGSRLWPLSRNGFPKQFLCLTGKESLFQQAAQRLDSLDNEEIKTTAPVIVTGEDHRFLASEQLSEVGIQPSYAILEPFGRNTAPALTLAALAALDGGGDAVLVVTPADQTVSNTSAFRSAMQNAIVEAAKGTIVIFGVAPTRPETGYGYIQINPKSQGKVDGLQDVDRFVEKPDSETARAYLNEGNHYWNAGMFVLKASVWLKALDKFRPDILQTTKTAWSKRSTDNKFVRPGQAEFAGIPTESVDNAAIERCPGSGFAIKMLLLEAGWNDLGAWDAVWNVLTKDPNGNTHLGDVISTDSQNTLVYATSRLVGLVGVKDLVVIETPDAILVADNSRCQDVTHIVRKLKETKRQEHALHRKVHRPWGWYDSIDEGLRFKVKRIQVNPKASLSLQKHHHRAEHWIVVKGTAEITNGDKTILITENQSTYIPLGETHRLANPGTIPLEIIEVQSGSYLGEDDIVRYEDPYGRQ